MYQFYSSLSSPFNKINYSCVIYILYILKALSSKRKEKDRKSNEIRSEKMGKSANVKITKTSGAERSDSRNEREMKETDKHEMLVFFLLRNVRRLQPRQLRATESAEPLQYSQQPHASSLIMFL